MNRSKTFTASVALALIGVSLLSLVCHFGARSETAEPTALWVCDTCGHSTREPLTDTSRDCPRCEGGQLVQRVFFRCKRCDTLFEGYQVVWSPQAPRAAAKRREADEQEPLPPHVHQPLLVRRPEGLWAWADASIGAKTIHELTCPHCGEGRRDQFTKVLDPPAP